MPRLFSRSAFTGLSAILGVTASLFLLMAPASAQVRGSAAVDEKGERVQLDRIDHRRDDLDDRLEGGRDDRRDSDRNDRNGRDRDRGDRDRGDRSDDRRDGRDYDRGRDREWDRDDRRDRDYDSDRVRGRDGTRDRGYDRGRDSRYGSDRRYDRDYSRRYDNDRRYDRDYRSRYGYRSNDYRSNRGSGFSLSVDLGDVTIGYSDGYRDGYYVYYNGRNRYRHRNWRRGYASRYDCHPVEYSEWRRGRHARIISTMCYDRSGYGYILPGSERILHWY